MPTAFASADELDAAALSAAPVHWPRPSRLDEAVTWKPRPGGRGGRGARPDHGRRPARPPAARLRRGAHDLRARARRDRDRHRRGALDQLAAGAPARHEAAGRGRGRRRHRGHEGHLLQPAVAQGPVQGRDPPHAGGQVPGRQPLPRQHPRAHRRGGERRGGRVAVPRDQGHHLDADPRRRARAPRRRRRRGRAAARRRCGSPSACPTAPLRSPPRTSATARRGRARLAFDELLVDQVVQLRLRAERRATQAAMPLAEAPTLSRVWRDTLLPFTPTGDQATAMDEIDADLAAERPMQRLLMGEVGSGKTVVALHAMLRAVEHGMQAALMAPTETLAEQHFATLQALMPGSLVAVALLTGSTPAGRRADLLGKLRTGELKLIVGTHALIEDAVEFERLAVAVVDEQHRFGVRQRAALDAKAGRVGSRAPRAAHDGHADPAHAAPRQLRRARRHRRCASCPRAASRSRRSSSAASASASAPTSASARSCAPAARRSSSARSSASPRRCRRARRPPSSSACRRPSSPTSASCCCTARCARARRRRRWRRFAAGGADVLVATTVIEVGIDVPNATVMLVEDAERYGISQLHQLRGRVGRGEDPSLCLLFGPAESPRLQALARHTRRLRAGRDRPRAARRGRADRHAPVGPRALSLRAPARGRGDPRARPRPRGGAGARGPRPAGARAGTAGRRARGGREGARGGVRVVAGRLGGRRLRAPRGRDTRPTSDRVREALFSMLGPLDGARVLDLFAGSGALAIEALSRGAQRRRSSSATGAPSRSFAPISRRSG